MLLLWYPKCSTCQRAKAWLDIHGIAYTLRDIRTDNPSLAELQRWYDLSGLPLKRFFNTSGQSYKALGLREKLPAMPEQEQLALLSTDGMLIKRPLLIGTDVILAGFKEAEWSAKLLG